MKFYTSKGAIAARKDCTWAKFNILFMLILAITSTQSALAQALGEWQEPPPVDADYDWPLIAIQGSLLPDGQILTWQTTRASVRLWDTSTGAFTCMPPYSMATIWCTGHVSLADGSLLVAGGGTPSNGSNQTNIYRYGSSFPGGPWEIGPSMEYGRWYPTCTTLGDGRVLAVAGFIESPDHATIPEIYHPIDGVNPDFWLSMDFADKQLPLYPFMFLLPSGKVFFAGPGIQNGPDRETFTLDLDTGFWDEDDPILSDYRAHDGTASMYEPGKIIRIGGSTPGQGTLSNVELIDFSDPTPAWSNATSMGTARIEHQTVLLADGTVFVIGGRDETDAKLKTSELYDPATDTWTDMANPSYFRYEHSIALLLPNGKVLSAGGNECFVPPIQQSSDCGFGHSHYCPAEVFAPPYLFAGPRPAIGLAPRTISYALDFVVSLSATSPISASGIAKVSLIRPGAMTHNFDQNQRYMELDFTTIGIGPPNSIFITAPANGNIAPPGYYMLFLISNDGVPSIAKFVQLQ